MAPIGPKRLLGLTWLFVLIVIPLSCGGTYSPAGGPCTYSNYPGSAEITELRVGPNGCQMIFNATFAGAQPRAGFYNPKSDSVLVGNPSGDTTPEWLASKGIVVGATFEMNLSLINSGSCSPVVHEFPALINIAH